MSEDIYIISKFIVVDTPSPTISNSLNHKNDKPRPTMDTALISLLGNLPMWSVRDLEWDS